MVDRIYDIKNQIIERIDQDLRNRGVERMDVNEMGEMVDMVKDLAEAEKACWEADYYRSITEAMEQGGQSGFHDGMYGYDGGGRGSSSGGSRSSSSSGSGRSGWQNQYGSGRSRRGYDSMVHGRMGHTDVVESVRMAMQDMDPAERERMKEQLRTAMEM